jgi:hypothetical protein
VIAISTMMAAGGERGLELRLRLARPVVDDHRQRGERTLQLLDESEQPTEQPRYRSLTDGGTRRRTPPGGTATLVDFALATRTASVGTAIRGLPLNLLGTHPDHIRMHLDKSQAWRSAVISPGFGRKQS